MDVFEAINTRRSVRKYKPDAIPEEKLKKVLDVMRQAPSAANRQPCKFIIVKDEKIRKAMLEECNAQEFLGQAPVVVVACGLDRDAWHGVGGNRNSSAVEIDVSIALDHLTLAAVAEGLGTCWVAAFNEPCFKKLLNIPERIRIISVTPLGFPLSGDMNHPLDDEKRKSYDELFCEDVYC